MRSLFIIFLMPIMLFATGCGKSSSATYFTEVKIKAPKVLMIDGPPSLWKVEVQKRLREKGFAVLDWRAQPRSTALHDGGTVTIYTEAASHYLVTIEGSANIDALHRCLGGGYDFDYINADLVNIVSNELIANYHGSGFSEQCPPLSGSLFTDLVNAIVNAWE